MIHSRVYIEKFNFSEIVRISSECSEERKGHHDEHTTEVVACKHDEKYYKFKIYCFSKTMGGKSYDTLEKIDISAEEHKKYANEYGGILDTVESRKAIKKVDQLNKQMDKVYPKCPTCFSKMIKRNGPSGPFLGCHDFSNCRGTRKYNINYEKKFRGITEERQLVQSLIKA